MCGIVGYFNPKRCVETLRPLYEATSLIAHRGPDDEGYAAFDLHTGRRQQYVGPDSPAVLQTQFPSIADHPAFAHHLAFGFRRFSIVDLSERGHQPFWNRDKSLCLIFNGEVYNYVEIRDELKRLGHAFVTDSDTEVLLAGYQEWGMDVLTRCNGPAALALYDARRGKLFLARDRIGKSPLYYGIHQGTLYWASEIKAILSMTGPSAFAISEQTVYDYLNFGWRDVDNTTFWEGIRTLDAACWVALDTAEPPTSARIAASLHRYWDFPQERLSTGDISLDEATIHFRDLFTDAVRIRARADAKVAFSLSGGLDSSSIVAVAAHTLPQRFRTYSLKFPGHQVDEEPLARLLYERYPDKIDYHTHLPGNEDFWNAANTLIWQLEEPFHYPDTEQFQAYLRRAKDDSYKVVLVGGGGDELLSGYIDYFYPLLKCLRRSRRLLPLAANLFLMRSLWPKYCLRKRIRIFRGLLSDPETDLSLYAPFSFFNRNGIDTGTQYLVDKEMSRRVKNRRNDFPKTYHGMVRGYLSDWLMNYWLRNSDRSHFGIPVETRRPYLDYRLSDFTLRLPPEYLVNFGWTKYILRKSVEKLVPHDIIWNRQKRGMPFNTVEWFSHAKPIVRNYLASNAGNPVVDTSALLNDYDVLVHRDPALLWRCVNFCLWWKRVIRRESL